MVLKPNPDGKRLPSSNEFGDSESFGGGDKLHVALPDWATQALNKLSMSHWTLDPQRMTLPDGITLIVQPESGSKTVTVMGHVDHDDTLQEPKGQSGVGRLLASLFDYGAPTWAAAPLQIAGCPRRQ